MSTAIELIKVDEENLTPEKYLNLDERERANIVSTKIIPAQLGKSDFGQIRVVYRNQMYKAAR